MESFILDQEDLDNPVLKTASELLLSSAADGADLRTVDPETQARLEALLEAAGESRYALPLCLSPPPAAHSSHTPRLHAFTHLFSPLFSDRISVVLSFVSCASNFQVLSPHHTSHFGSAAMLVDLGVCVVLVK